MEEEGRVNETRQSLCFNSTFVDLGCDLPYKCLNSSLAATSYHTLSTMTTIRDLVPSIYFEKQEPGTALCAQHALNSLLRQSISLPSRPH